MLVAEQAAGTWRGAGDKSFDAWRVRTSGAAPRSAAVQVRQAEHLAADPEVAAAVTDGSIGLEQAEVIAKLAATGSPAQRAALAAGGREELMEAARTQDAGTLAITAARWAATVDPVKHDADHEAQRRKRYLSVLTSPTGTAVRGLLDNMAGHRLRLALEAATTRPAADDDRDPGQRAADALDTIAIGVLSSPDTKPGAHVPPHVSLIMDVETIVSSRALRDRQRAARTEGRALEPQVGGGYPPVTLEDGTPVPISEAAVALCDCAVTRVGIDADGVPMDLGRTQRLFTGEIRRAILARDRECAWPTCHMPARWTQIHHLKWWGRDNGSTSVDDGAPFCNYHHHEVHSRDLHITRITDRTDDGPPGKRRRRRPIGDIALVHYELRDPTGQLVGEPATAVTGAAATPAPLPLPLPLPRSSQGRGQGQ